MSWNMNNIKDCTPCVLSDSARISHQKLCNVYLIVSRCVLSQIDIASKNSTLLKLAEKWKTTRLKAEMARLKECRDDEVWWKVTEGDGTMWQRFDEEEKCWRVWGRRKTGVNRQWRTWPQLMCCALACGTRCPLISGARKTVRMMENKARMYRF